MERWEIETKLNRDRAWLLDTYAALSAEDLSRPATPSEHDPSSMWSAADHLAHLAGIELSLNGMIRKHLDGQPNPVGLRENPDGSPRTMEEAMTTVHAMTEEWVERHRGKSLSEIVALGQAARADTLALLAELSDERLRETLPGAPWADGTIGAVIAINADHGRMHFNWVKEGWEARANG